MDAAARHDFVIKDSVLKTASFSQIHPQPGELVGEEMLREFSLIVEDAVVREVHVKPVES